ncbi:PilZ domain-containing protein [Clostridium sp.]
MNLQNEGNNSIQKILSNSVSDESGGLFRVKLFYNLTSEIKIESISGKKTDLNGTKVLINDISPSGLKFISNLTLPVNPAVIFNLKSLILHETINLFGHIVWAEESVGGLYEYGIKFIQDDSKEQYLIKLLNTLQISIRRSPLVSGCSFYTGNSIKYFLDFDKEKAENLDLVETKNLMLKYEDEIINNYKNLLEIYRKYKGIEEIEGSIFNFITLVKQVVDKFDL